MKQAPVSLVNLSVEEKNKIDQLSHRNMVRGIGMYLIPFIIFGILVGYANVHPEKLGLLENPDLRAWINVVLVFLTILPARLFVNVILRHRKATNAYQKKVIHGIITGIDGKIITCANQKIKLNPELLAKVKVNDDVIVSVLPSGDLVLSIEVIGK